MSAQPEALRLADSLANADRTLVMHERASDVVFYRPRDKGSDIDLAAAELRHQHAEIESMRTVMVAAAEEIAAHWQAHCDSEGYGPQNLLHRLERGIPSQYGYTAGAFATLKAEAESLRAEVARLGKAAADNFAAAVQAQEALARHESAGEAPGGEAVAWVNPANLASAAVSRERGGPFDQHTLSEQRTDYHTAPLYAHTPASRQMVPLTDEQIDAGVEAWFTTDITINGGEDRGHPFRQRMRAAIERAHGIGAPAQPRAELLALAEACGAVLTGKPDGSEPVTVTFTISAWRAFDARLRVFRGCAA